MGHVPEPAYAVVTGGMTNLTSFPLGVGRMIGYDLFPPWGSVRLIPLGAGMNHYPFPGPTLGGTEGHVPDPTLGGTDGVI